VGRCALRFICTQVRITILRVSGNSGKNIAVVKLKMFPDFVCRETKTQALRLSVGKNLAAQGGRPIIYTQPSRERRAWK
jgi:ribosomal protein L16/L10AE